ncbi:hypothetical protein L596_006637 [Steinernema carpocapsae]|uniref:Uncharacterized protein n=1 Tax=Steinernema carpocapsae TaxID=34508 RepID=A0A4U8VBY2_STECR|nr:hypothetical protein L596_006637 [Steinernema carpocapsae]
MMGVFVFALLVGQIRDIVSNANKNRENFRSTMDLELTKYKRLQLPKHTIDRVRDWLNYTWEQQRTLDEKKLIKKLPLKLQTNFALSVNFNRLGKVSLFQVATVHILAFCLPTMQEAFDSTCAPRPVASPRHLLTWRYDLKEVRRWQGDVHRQSRNPRSCRKRKERDSLFGAQRRQRVRQNQSSLAIDGNHRRTANIRSKGYSTLFSLSKEDLNDAIKDYLKAQQILHRKAQEILNKNKKEKKEKTDDDVRREFEEKCRIQTSIATSRMLETVKHLFRV